jgi:hypothetical protein
MPHGTLDPNEEIFSSRWHRSSTAKYRDFTHNQGQECNSPVTTIAAE